MASETFDFVLRAIDQATAPIRAIAEAFKGVTTEAKHTKAAAHGAAHGVHEVTEHTRGIMALGAHVHILRGHFGELNAGVTEVGHSITEFLPMLGALGAAGSLVGLFELTEHVAELRSEFVKTATEIGILPKQLAALNMAAKLTDVPVETMQGGLVKLDKAIATAASGKNKDAAALFAHLGISLRDSHGHLVSVADVMPRLEDAFKNTSDPALRVRAAMALFGKTGADMIPMLIEGSEELKKFGEIAAKVNYSPSKQEADGLEEFHRSWIILQSAVNGVVAAIGSKLAPVLAPVLDMATEWVVANRDWIATGIANKVGELAHWIESLNLRQVLDQTREWITSLGSLTGHVGGFGAAIGAATLVIGSPLLSAMTAVITIVGTLGKALMALGSLVWANPILAAVGLVAVAAYEIYEHWDWVKGQMQAIFTWFSGQSGWVQGLIVAVAPVIGLPMLIIAHWDEITAFFPRLWDGVKVAFQVGMKDVGAAMQAISDLPQTLMQRWEPVRAFFADLWSGIKGAFDGALSHIQPIADNIGGLADRVAHSWVGQHVLGLGAEPAAASAAVGGPGGAAAAGAPPGSPFYAPPPLPSPYRTGGGGGGRGRGADRDGKVHVQVDINNLPPGSTARAQGTGAAQTPDLNVGYAYPVGGF